MNKIKVIIGVNKASDYSRFNGLTFDVKSVMGRACGVLLDGHETDFAWKEVTVVDFQQRYQEAYDGHNFNGSTTKEYNALSYYAEQKGIKWQPVYRCPA